MTWDDPMGFPPERQFTWRMAIPTSFAVRFDAADGSSDAIRRAMDEAHERAMASLNRLMSEGMAYVVRHHVDLGGSEDDIMYAMRMDHLDLRHVGVIDLKGDREIARVIARCEPDEFNVRVIVEWSP